MQHNIPLKISRTPVDEHTDEEHRIEVWDVGRPAYDKAPRKRLDPVGGVVLGHDNAKE
jgi:hypothetical protein